MIPRIETPEFTFFRSILLADFGTLTVTLALVPGLICSGKLTLAAVFLPRTLTVAWALVTWQLLPSESLLGQLTLTAAKLLLFARLTGLPEFSLLIVGGVEVGPVSPVGPVAPVAPVSAGCSRGSSLTGRTGRPGLARGSGLTGWADGTGGSG